MGMEMDTYIYSPIILKGILGQLHSLCGIQGGWELTVVCDVMCALQLWFRTVELHLSLKERRS